MDFEQKLHSFLQERKNSELLLAFQDMRLLEQDILVPVVQLVGDKNHIMIVLDQEFATYKYPPTGPSFMRDYCGTWKELPDHVKHFAKEDIRFFCRMDLANVRFIQKREKHMRIYAFNRQSSVRLDRILGTLPVCKWPTTLDMGPFSEDDLRNLAAKWCPEALTSSNDTSGDPKQYLASQLENVHDFPQFFVNHSHPSAEMENEEEETNEFPPFHNMAVRRVVSLLKLDYYFDQKYPDLVDFAVDSFNLAEIEPELESDLYA